jgi:sugar/nucleoside kinase (ribokinase family)
MAGIAYLGGNSSFIGKINSDEFGKIYKKSLEKINVNFPTLKKMKIYQRAHPLFL